MATQQPKLGDMLLNAGLVTRAQLEAALAEQHRSGGKLGEVLVRLGLVSEDALADALARQLEVPRAEVEAVVFLPSGVRECVPAALAHRLPALPLALEDSGRTLVVAMAEPQNPRQLEALRQVTGRRLLPRVAGKTALLRAVGRIYGKAEAPQGETGQASAGGNPPAGRNHGAGQSGAGQSGAGQSSAGQASAGPGEAGRGSLDVAAVEALVELLVERGLITREEYVTRLLARVRGQG